MLNVPIFMGPCYYQQLRHMGADKVHSRAVGPRAILTRQPTEGRNRDGGIRTGEMEKDAFIAHGAGFALRDRLSDNSDATPVVICRSCGRLAEHKHSSRFGRGIHKKPFCRGCKAYNCVTIPVPFATILLLRELEAMHIVPKITLRDVEEFNGDVAQPVPSEPLLTELNTVLQDLKVNAPVF